MTAWLAVPIGFMLGSLPWSLWYARWQGVDLRLHGSGNLGATNVYRVLGWKPGLLVLILDVAKGAAAVALAKTLSPSGAVAAAAALAAVAGHSFSPLAGFRGGKGVATGLGVFLALAPVAAGMGLLVWGATLALGGWVSVASGLVAVVLPFFVAATRHDLGERYPWILGLAITVALLVLVRHRTNWKRLAQGREQAIWENRPEDPETGAAPLPKLEDTPS